MLISLCFRRQTADRAPGRWRPRKVDVCPLKQGECPPHVIGCLLMTILTRCTGPPAPPPASAPAALASSPPGWIARHPNTPQVGHCTMGNLVQPGGFSLLGA